MLQAEHSRAATPAAGSSRVAITASAVAAIRAAALAAGTREACGLLFGHPGQVIEARVARNVAAEPERRFEIDPADLFAAHRRGREGPLKLIGVWHSHPGGTLVPSVHDAAGISDRDWLWIIEAEGRLAGFLPDAAAASGFRSVMLAEDGPNAL